MLTGSVEGKGGEFLDLSPGGKWVGYGRCFMNVSEMNEVSNSLNILRYPQYPNENDPINTYIHRLEPQCPYPSPPPSLTIIKKRIST